MNETEIIEEDFFMKSDNSLDFIPIKSKIRAPFCMKNILVMYNFDLYFILIASQTKVKG